METKIQICTSVGSAQMLCSQVKDKETAKVIFNDIKNAVESKDREWIEFDSIYGNPVSIKVSEIRYFTVAEAVPTPKPPEPKPAPENPQPPVDNATYNKILEKAIKLLSDNEDSEKWKGDK